MSMNVRRTRTRATRIQCVSMKLADSLARVGKDTRAVAITASILTNACNKMLVMKTLHVSIQTAPLLALAKMDICSTRQETAHVQVS